MNAPPSDSAAHQAETRRQQALLTLLRLPPQSQAAQSHARQDAGLRGHADAGLHAYRGNAQATAGRALAAAHPTVCAMLGEEGFAHLAQELWLASPPRRGDLAEWGADLPAHLAGHAQLTPWPWLADSARVDWAAHRAERAADAAWEPQTLALLESAEPDALHIDLLPGSAVLRSRFPLATLHRAHHAPDEAGRSAALQAARDALARGDGEDVIVWRSGWRAEVAALPAPWAGFCGALLAGRSLGAALAAQDDDDFDFSAWLLHAVRHGWLWRMRSTPPDRRAA